MSSSSNEVTATGITTNHANDPAPTEVAIAPRRSSRRLSIVKRVVMKEVDEFDDDDEEQEDDTNNDESQEAPSTKHTAKKARKANPMKKSAREKKVTAPRKREKPVVRKKSAPRMKPVVTNDIDVMVSTILPSTNGSSAPRASRRSVKQPISYAEQDDTFANDANDNDIDFECYDAKSDDNDSVFDCDDDEDNAMLRVSKRAMKRIKKK